MASRKTSIAHCLLTLLVGVVAGTPHPAASETSTLTLDTLSFISFEDDVTMALPAGGTIEFHFGTPNVDGSIPFQIAPSDVVIPAVPSTTLNVTMQYGLSSQVSGLLTPTESGHRISFFGSMSAKDVSNPESGTRTYPLSFTTERATATSVDGSAVVSRDGYRVPDGANYVQLVGATVAKSENEHGSAVYMVLSGSFDQLP